MDVLLAPVLLVWLALPLVVVATPPVIALTVRRLTLPAAVLHLVAAGLVVRYFVAADADLGWAGGTGGAGSIWAGGGWLVGAAAAATAAVVHLVRSRRPAPRTS